MEKVFLTKTVSPDLRKYYQSRWVKRFLRSQEFSVTSNITGTEGS